MALRYRQCIYNGKLHWEDTELADHTWKYKILVRARVVAKLHESVAEKVALLPNLVHVCVVLFT
jgi:hypothetical protein